MTDDFIELDEVRIDTKRDPEDKGYPEICFRFGDKVPFRSSVVIPAVGNSANAAISATRLGLKTAFVTDIGDDDRGKKKLETFRKNGVDTRFIEVHEGMQSNYHYVLRYQAERTILVKHETYPYSLPTDMEAPKWIYLSSVGEHGLQYHHEIAQYVEQHPETRLAFQPGTFQIEFGYEKIKDVYAQTDIFFCNKEEAQRILNKTEQNIKELLKDIRALGPQVAVITDGPKGAYADDGNEVWFITMYPDSKAPVDRTGAGDAFASTFTSAIALGKSIPEALSWGPINSMSVVQYIGAQEGLMPREQLEKHLADAPENYKPQKIA